MDWNEFLNNVLTGLVAIIVAMIPVVVPIIVNRLLDKWKIEADAERRKALTTAIVNGLIQALDRQGVKKDQPITPSTRTKAVIEAAEYAAKTVPGTIKQLGVPPENLVELAKSHLPQVLGTFGPLGTLIGTVGAAVIDVATGEPAKQGRT